MMHLRLILLSILACSGMHLSTAQTNTSLSKANADCSGIIDLSMPGDTIYGPTTPPTGPGNVAEISGESNSLYAFEQEHNTVWYRFKVPSDGVMTFDIIPVNINDDYDFILFKYSGQNFCNEVQNKILKPVRTCISRNNTAKGSKTGLSPEANDEFVHSGIGPSYVKSIEVARGDIYVLVLDNVYPNGSGHVIKFHFKNNKPAAQHQQIAEKSALSVTIIDKESKALVPAKARIYPKNKKTEPPVKTFESSSSFNMDIDAGTTYFIKIEADGYFDYSVEVAAGTQPGSLNIKAELDKIVVGKNIIFDNILFFGNEARILPESVPVLEDIANTMKKNPNVVIEIQGHVNCPTIWETCDNKKTKATNLNLSVNRAKAVYEYLMQTGIDHTRMTYNGYGATKMIYPDARSEQKQKLNRRVEIVIVSNE